MKCKCGAEHGLAVLSPGLRCTPCLIAERAALLAACKEFVREYANEQIISEERIPHWIHAHARAFRVAIADAEKECET